ERAQSRVLLTNNEEFVHHSPDDDQQLLGIFAPLHFPYRVDDILRNSTSVPRLSEMAVKAIQVMNKQSNSQGYFLMIEGANIDKAQHKNQFHLAIEELNEFDKAIEQVSKMVDEDTLIIVTADHAHALTIPGYLNKSHSIFERDGNVTSIFFATGPGYGDGNRSMYTSEESYDPHFAQPSAHFFNDARHGGEDVGIWAKGPYAWLFTGSMENTQLAYNIKYLMCLNEKEQNICDHKKEINEKKRRMGNSMSASSLASQNSAVRIINVTLPIRGTLIALFITTCTLTVLAAVLLMLLLRTKFGGTVKPSDIS
ncbi:hypothetical protein PRIPAC_80595, partial [Pristionchus pacificus]